MSSSSLLKGKPIEVRERQAKEQADAPIERCKCVAEGTFDRFRGSMDGR
jgi:hypothetical protein